MEKRALEIAQNLRAGRTYRKTTASTGVKYLTISYDAGYGDFPPRWVQTTHWERVNPVDDGVMVLDEDEAIDRIMGMHFHLVPNA